jgi:hypothetical protein
MKNKKFSTRGICRRWGKFWWRAGHFCEFDLDLCQIQPRSSTAGVRLHVVYAKFRDDRIIFVNFSLNLTLWVQWPWPLPNLTHPMALLGSDYTRVWEIWRRSINRCRRRRRTNKHTNSPQVLVWYQPRSHVTHSTETLKWPIMMH